jgi:phosphonate transport system substrate-binding protein
MNILPRASRSVVYGSLLVLLVAAALGVSAYYYMTILRPVQANAASNEHMAAQIVGLSNIRIVHHLSADFTDSQGNLVADPPTDPSKLADPDTLVLSWIGEDNQTYSADDFKALSDHLAQATGKQVAFDADISSTDEQLKALRDGKLHITVFSTGAVPFAVNVAGFIPVGMLSGESGNSKYQMQIIVPASSDISAVSDLKGHELALTEPSSNAGYKAPIVLLQNEYGLVFERDYRTRATLSYDNSIRGIAKVQFDAAAVASDVLDRAVAAGTIKKTDYRVIYTSADFPRAAIGYAYNLKPDLAAKIKDALLSFDFKGTPLEARFAGQNIARFAPVDYRNDWEVVRLIDDTIAGPQVIK